MIINGKTLLLAAPIENMLNCKVKYKGVSHGLSEAGYDIRIKQEIRFHTTNRNQRRIYIDDRNAYQEGGFTLASSVEKFTMPSNLVGIVHDKSTWARRGLSVFNTVIEPGWYGYLTLELVYHGNQELIIPAGSGIAQVIFHEVVENTAYSGKYQNQADKPVFAIESI